MIQGNELDLVAVVPPPDAICWIYGYPTVNNAVSVYLNNKDFLCKASGCFGVWKRACPLIMRTDISHIPVVCGWETGLTGSSAASGGGGIVSVGDL